jgi:uncharacterized membrane protein HdeD (DUF308 family)
LVATVKSAVGAKEFLVFGGLAMLGCGLFLLYSPGLALSVCGPILMLIGIFHQPDGEGGGS